MMSRELTRTMPVRPVVGVAPGDVIAIGDEMNDLRMLQWAGRGIAMANAHEQVREIADEVIGTNTDDGVAQFLDTLGSA